MEPIEVLVRFDADGGITPLNFVWQGLRYTVESVGRSWQDERGQHILVMIPGERVFELLCDFGERRWYIRPVAPPRQAF